MDPPNFAQWLFEKRIIDRDRSQLPPLPGQAQQWDAWLRSLVHCEALTAFQYEMIRAGRAAELVIGSYVILSMLGEGGMGVVYKARHLRLGRLVALKVIQANRLHNPRAIKRFLREIRAVAQLSHPNVVVAYDADEIDNTLLFTMELVDGADLEQVVCTRGVLTPAEACSYLLQTALGLQHAYERGLIHRDLKPNNLLLTRRPEVGGDRFGTVKILDFGLSLLHDSESTGESSALLTGDGTFVGTPDFMSPEQAVNAHNVDIRSDLYSLGCSFYYLLAGRVPFPGKSAMEKLLRHMNEPPTSLQQIRPDVPPVFIGVIHKLMAKAPEARFQTPAELIAALRTMQSTVEIAPLAVPVIEPVPLAEPVSKSSTWHSSYSDPSSSPTASASLLPKLGSERSYRRQVPLWAALGATLLLGGLLIFGVISSTSPPTNSTTEATMPDATTAAGQWQILSQNYDKGLITRAQYAQQLLQFRHDYPATPQALKAAAQLRRLPSLFDRLPRTTSQQLPAAFWPADLVTLFGERTFQPWFPPTLLALQADGSRLAWVENRLIRLFDLTADREIGLLRGHNAEPMSLQFSPDGQELASAAFDGPLGWDRTIRRWRLPDGSEILSEQNKRLDLWCTSIRYTQDGKTLLLGSYSEAAHFDRGSEQIQTRWGLNANWLLDVRYSEDGKWLLAVSADGTLVWRKTIAKADPIRALTPDPYRKLWAHFGPNAKTIYVVRQPGTFYEFDRDTGALLHEWNFGGKVTAFAFAEGGTTGLAGTDTGSVRVLKFKEREELRQVKEVHSGAIHAIVPDSESRFFSTGADRRLVWFDLRRERKLRVSDALPQGGQLWAMAPDGQQLAVIAPLRVWETESGKPLAILDDTEAPARSITFSPQGDVFYTGHDAGRIRKWKANNAARLAEWFLPERHSVRALAVSLDGQTLFLTTTERKTYALRTDEGGVAAVVPVENSATQLRLSPNGRHLLAISTAGKVSIFRADELHQKPIVLTASIFFDDASLVGETKISAAAWFPSADRLILGSSRGHLMVRAFPNREKILDLGKLDYPIAACAVSDSGHAIAVLDDEGGLFLYDSESGRQVKKWRFPGHCPSLRFTPDSRHLIVMTGNGALAVLRTEALP